MKRYYQTKLILFFLISVILVDFIGMATVVVVLPKLLLSGSEIFSKTMMQSERLMWMGVLLALYPFGQIIGASFFGRLSDYYGRKKLLIVTLCGTFICYLLSGVSIELHFPVILFLSRLISGFFAGNVAIAQASLLDISTNKTKTKNIALGQMAMGSAYIIGPIMGAILSESEIVSWFDSATPFWFLSLLLVCIIFLTIFNYKETLIHRKEGTIELIDSLRQIQNGFLNKKMRQTFIVWLLFVSGWWLFESFMPTYLLQRFNFTTSQIGSVLSYNGALYATFQYMVVRKLSHKFKPEKLVEASGIIVGFSMIALIYVSNVYELYLAMSVFVISMGFMIPGLISYIAKLCDEREQGEVMGTVNSIQAISTVIVMLCGGYLNAISNALSICGGGVLVLSSWVLFILILRKTNQSLEYTVDIR